MNRKRQKSYLLPSFRVDILLVIVTILCISFASKTYVGCGASLLLSAWLGGRTSGRLVGCMTGFITALYFQFSVAWFLLMSGLELIPSPLFLFFAAILALIGGWVGGLIVTRPRPPAHGLPQT